MIYDLDKEYSSIMADATLSSVDYALSTKIMSIPTNDDWLNVLTKICFIDSLLSTNLKKQNKKITMVSLAMKIVEFNKEHNLDERIAKGDLDVVDELAHICEGVCLLSFASKYVCYHNNFAYGRDDYYIVDTVVSKAISCHSRKYKDYHEKMEQVAKNCGVKSVNNYRRKLDRVLWWTYKNDKEQDEMEAFKGMGETE